MDHVHYSKNGENWVDLSNVPLKVWGERYIYNWCKIDTWVEVPFKYKDLEDTMLVKYPHIDDGGPYCIALNYDACKIKSWVGDLQKVSLGGLLNKIPVAKPNMMKFFKGGFYEARNYNFGSNKKLNLFCPNCNHEKQISPCRINYHGFACPRCSNSISFPERFTGSLLDEIGFKYETQKRFEGKTWRFDFYIPYLELVIEVHGRQHFDNAWTVKDEVTTNDNNKRKFIKFELGLNYAAIDISVSEPYYAWGMLEQNEHLEPYIQDIDYDNVVERCNDSVLNKNHNDIIRDYKRGIRLSELSRKYEIDKSTLRDKLLKNGVYKNSKRYKTPVICITTGERFESATQASREINRVMSSIINCCQGRQKSAGKTPDGRKRVWMYLEDYEKQLKVN